MKPEDVQLREVLFEFQRHGNYVRITAVDTRTNTEIVMVGDAQVGETYLKRAAMRKLRYVIARNHNKRYGDGSVIA